MVKKTQTKKTATVKKTKKVKTKSKKTKSEPVVEQTPQPVVEQTPQPVVEQTPQPVVEQTPQMSSSESLYLTIIEQSKEMTQLHKKITSTLKKVHKAYHRECKELKKKTSKNRRRVKDPNKPKRAPSGFAKPYSNHQYSM